MIPTVWPLIGSIPISLFFSINGAAPTAVNTNANGNYSGVNLTRFQLIPPTNERWVIDNVVYFLECAGSISEDGFGQAGTPLTVGIHYRLLDSTNTEIFNYNSGIPILKNTDWYQYADDVMVRATNQLPVLNCTLRQMQPILLDGSLGHRLSFDLNDNFTGRNILFQRFFANGIKLRTYESKGISVYNGY